MTLLSRWVQTVWELLRSNSKLCSAPMMKVRECSMQGGEIKCTSLSHWCKMRLLAAEPSGYKTNILFHFGGGGRVYSVNLSSSLHS